MKGFLRDNGLSLVLIALFVLLRQAARLNQRGSVANDMREVEQDAMRFALNSMGPQDDGCSTRQDVRIGVMRCPEMFCPFPTANQTA
jgi:hypothetical protein